MLRLMTFLRLTKFDDSQLRDKWLVLLEFFRSKKPLPIFSSHVKIRIWTFLFYKKKVPEKVNFFKIFRGRYFVLRVRTDTFLSRLKY